MGSRIVFASPWILVTVWIAPGVTYVGKVKVSLKALMDPLEQQRTSENAPIVQFPI